MGEAVDFLSLCEAGMVVLTRDGSRARITCVAAEEGLIYGDVAMFGPCCWRADGIYRDSPCGAAGPLDLVAAAPDSPARRPKVASVKDSLTAEHRFFCCD